MRIDLRHVNVEAGKHSDQPRCLVAFLQGRSGLLVEWLQSHASPICTPGCFSAMSDILRITSSVRSSVAPFGNCANDTRYPLSCVGTNPAGTREKPRMVSPIRPA